MSVPSAEVVIVGGGLEGLSSAWALTQRGVDDIVVLERHSLASAGTGKSSGVVRCHYGVRSLAAMAWRGTHVMENAADLLEAEVGFEQVGYVVGVGPGNVEPFRASVAAQQSLGIDTRLVGHDDVARLWPQARLDDFAAFAYEPRGGYGDAYSLAMAFAGAARRAGAAIRQNVSVAELIVETDRVRGVRLSDGSDVHAETVVVAAGPWTVGLLAPHGLDLPIRVHREPILILDPGEPVGEVPVFSDLVLLQYLRTERSGAVLVGNSDLSTLRDADPDHYLDGATEEELESAAQKFAARFPKWIAAGVRSSYAGCYDVTPDFNPVISATGIAGLFVAAGFSGHGFKISPAVGELMADLVTGEHGSVAGVVARDFRLERFAEHDLLVTPFPYRGAGQMR